MTTAPKPVAVVPLETSRAQQILDLVIAAYAAHDRKDVRAEHCRIAELYAAVAALPSWARPAKIAPYGTGVVQLPSGGGYDVTLDGDRAIVRVHELGLHELSERDAAVSMTGEQVERMRVELGAVAAQLWEVSR